MINVVSNHRHIYRSAWECENCGKIIYSEKLEPTCKITNWTLER
nr:MAG TPA: MqsA [Caudoviricetes sp.]